MNTNCESHSPSSPVYERQDTLLKILNTAEGLKDYLKLARYQKSIAKSKMDESMAEDKIDAIHKDLLKLV